MKKTLLLFLSIGVFAATANAQTYDPVAGSALAGAEEGMTYPGQTINAAIPTTVDITGQDILDVIPAQAAALLGSALDPNATYTVDVTSTVLTVEGLPNGLVDDCGGCTVNGGSNRDIMISGTPSEGGVFTVNVTSETTGSTEIDVPFLGTQVVTFGGSLQSFPVPTLPGVMDAEGYTMSVATGIEEANDTFSLGFYPNPTNGDATLEVNTIEAGVATVEVYSITGSRVLSTSESISVGLNRIDVDMNGVPAGIYLIKADINGAQALIRTQKI